MKSRMIRKISACIMAFALTFGAVGCTSQVTPSSDAGAADSAPTEDEIETRIQEAVDKLNRRPRKCLGYRTPYEVFYDVVLHLV